MGLTFEQAVGKNFFDLKYPDDLADKLQRQIQQVIDTRQTLVDETPYTRPSGAGGYYQYIFSPVIGSHGTVEAVAGSIRDMSDRKRADEERKLLASVVENSPDFIGCSDAEGNPIFVNRAGRKLVGLDEDHDIRQTHIPEYFVPSGASSRRSSYPPSSRTGGGPVN